MSAATAAGFSAAVRARVSGWGESLPIPNCAAKSLQFNILPITPLDGIFCEERFFIALCFQYFAEVVGGGGIQLPVTSGQLSVSLSQYGSITYM